MPEVMNDSQLPRLVEGGKAADPRAGEGASRVHHLLQDGVEVEVLGDADARLTQSGEAVPQGFYLPFQAVCWLQCTTSLVLLMALNSSIPRTGWIRCLE